MSVMDKIKQMLKGHEGESRRGRHRAEERVQERSRGEYPSQADIVREKLGDDFGPQDKNPPRS
ncbi:antitoxin [Streptomyces cavernae]|uniref:antitoxin n=1 Tax=Streptomyces cavernae TaxID=2259034 RepID=UPI000FEBC9B7|nr:antitoxin [Streptomyces cavernae]